MLLGPTESREVNSHLSFVEEAADGADDAGRAGTEHLQDSSSVQSSDQLLHIHSALRDFELSLTETHKANILKHLEHAMVAILRA